MNQSLFWQQVTVTVDVLFERRGTLTSHWVAHSAILGTVICVVKRWQDITLSKLRRQPAVAYTHVYDKRDR